MTDIGPARGPTGQPVLEQTGFRLSWGAVFAGMFVATALHIVLALLGLAIGMEIWEPGDRVDVLGGRLGIWVVLSGIIALFVGGMTTGRLAGVLTRGDGALHGVLLWSLSTILVAWLLASGVSTLLGTAVGLVGRTAGAAVGGAAQIGAAAVGQVGGLDLQAIEREVEQALRETGDPALQPDTLTADAERIGERATGPASTADIARDIRETIIQRGGRVDRDALVNVLAARTDMNRAEAERVAIRIDNLATDIAQQAGTALDTAGVYAERAAEEASAAVGSAAWWGLLALGLSLGSAVGGVVIRARE